MPWVVVALNVLDYFLRGLVAVAVYSRHAVFVFQISQVIVAATFQPLPVLSHLILQPSIMLISQIAYEKDDSAGLDIEHWPPHYYYIPVWLRGLFSS